MVVSDEIHNIMGGIESAGDVRLHNHRRKLKQRFDIVKKLGQGTYGKVQLGINKETGQEVAIKTIRKCKIETEADLIRIRREIQIMSSVRHPNIIHIYEVFENREKMVLVMEYAAGGELYDYLSERKVLTEDEARRIFRQIATAVYYCHKHNICHRDLKLENILLDEVGNAKIADFGLSNVFTFTSLLSTFCGSPLYASPEIVKGTPYRGPEVDCWSLGVLLYTLVYGAMPFDGSNFKRLVKQISQGNYFEPKNPSPASPLISDMLNVNPSRRANITAICSHWWINETYKEICLDVAEDLASQTPVRLDLLLSLTAPAVNTEKIVVGVEPVVSNEDLNGKVDRPVRSQSLGSIPPAIAPHVPSLTLPETPETKETIVEEKKPKVRKKDGGAHVKTKRKERSRSRPRKSEESDKKTATPKEDSNESEPSQPPALTNSGTQVIATAEPNKSTPAQATPAPTTVPSKTPTLEKEPSRDEEPKPKTMERRKSKVYEVAEKFIEKPTVPPAKQVPPKKVVLTVDTNDVRPELERRSSLAASKEKTSVGSTSPDEECSFPLASTVALNKLVESAFRDEEPPFKMPSPPAAEVEKAAAEKENAKVAVPIVPAGVVETSNGSKAATLPRRRTSRAEIQLVQPQFPQDNYKSEVEHFVNKPTVNHKTEIVFPVSPPLPPKPLSRNDNQSKEHIIPIQLDPEARQITRPAAANPLQTSSQAYSASKSSIARTSSSSLSRQSTVDSDSGSTISTGEPIRKSPREVIIPIAVEGGGFVTPSNDTLTRMNSANESEDEGKNNNNSRCFTLRSTKKRPQPERNESTQQLDTADSLSSDEDDNFQLLTAENLFSTLLSRVRSLTQRLNNDDMRRSSAFPRSLFANHSSLFDNMPSRRLTETRSFNRPENTPWRRITTSSSTSSGNQPSRDDTIKKRYSRINEEKSPCSARSVASINSTSASKPIDDLKSKLSRLRMPEPRGDTAAVKSSQTVSLPATPLGVADTAAKSEGASKSAKRFSIQDEFDKFFSKYRSSKPPGGGRLSAFDVNAAAAAAAGAPPKPRISRLSKERSVDEMPNGNGAKDDEAATVKPRPQRRSRFLRPDFYDTPREESKYVIKNEKVRAFRERSLSRQRDLSRNRSNDSFTPNGGATGGTDYVRSKTCSLADQGAAETGRDFRRTSSEEARTNGGVVAAADCKRRSMILPDTTSFEIPTRADAASQRANRFDPSKRKSMMLQSELETQMRKTQNINTKLSGLMEALNDAENEYEKKLERLYGGRGAAAATSNGQPEEQAPAPVERTTRAGTPTVFAATEDEQPRDDKRTFAERKYAYFRRLQNSDRKKDATNSSSAAAAERRSEERTAAASSQPPLPEPEASGTATTSTPTEEVDSSDAWSQVSDSGDSSQYLDNVKDRIRRRSFYSRFNLSKQRSTSNANRAPTSLSPTAAYSRSLSADYKTRSTE